LKEKATKLSAIMYYNFEPLNLKILGGYTGTGKTEILHSLKKGQQVDLEGLANHRGSAFGGTFRHSQQQYKTICFLVQSLNPTLPIWVG
jgi:tRNA 2-selenouridine synthase